MLEKELKECFNTDSIYFQKMLDIFKEEQFPPYNKHHIVPRSYFRKKGRKIISKDNLINLSIKNHLLVHYYAWKCANPIIKKEMAAATKWIFSKNISDKNILIEAEEFSKIRKEVEEQEKTWNKEKSKRILYLEENKIYNSLHDCAKATNCDYRLISNTINGKRISVNRKHFIVAEKENYSFEECQNIIIVLEQKRHKSTGRSYAIKCLETNQIFENGHQASKILGINYASLNYALNHSGKTNGYTFVKIKI